MRRSHLSMMYQGKCAKLASMGDLAWHGRGSSASRHTSDYGALGACTSRIGALSERGERVKQQLVPSSTSLSFLYQDCRTSMLNLLWQVVWSTYVKDRPSTRFAPFYSLIFSPDDWRALEAIVASRCWRLIFENDASGTVAFLDEVEQ